MSATPLRSLSWMDRAACKGMPIDTFFPDRGGKARAAIAVCATCDVRDDCLAFCLETPAQFDTGVFGGTSPRQRRGMRTRRNERTDG